MSISSNYEPFSILCNNLGLEIEIIPLTNVPIGLQLQTRHHPWHHTSSCIYAAENNIWITIYSFTWIELKPPDANRSLKEHVMSNIIILWTSEDSVCYRVQLFHTLKHHRSWKWNNFRIESPRQYAIECKNIFKKWPDLWCISRSCTSDWFSKWANWRASLNSFTESKKTLTASELYSLKIITECFCVISWFFFLHNFSQVTKGWSRIVKSITLSTLDLFKKGRSVFKVQVISNWRNSLWVAPREQISPTHDYNLRFIWEDIKWVQ